MIYKRLSGIIIWFLLVVLPGYSQVFEETKTYSRNFKATATTVVDISNKYGTILVSTWEKDSVSIKITLKILERNENRFNKIKENVSFDFSHSGSSIKANTVFGSKYASLIKNVAEATNYRSADSEQTRIEYQIKVPSYINLTIDNKYGDIILPSLKGNVKITMSNGNLQCRDIDGQTELDLDFGNAEFNNLRQVNASLNFIQLNANKVGSMTLNGRSSQIDIETVETIRLNSRRDKINISKISSIYGESYFSKLQLKTVLKECQLKLSYGRLSMLNMASGFKKLELNSQACDLNIQLTKPQVYNALIQAQNTEISIPPELKSSDPAYESKIETTPIRFLYKQQLSKSKIKINITGADLKISHQ